MNTIRLKRKLVKLVLKSHNLDILSGPAIFTNVYQRKISARMTLPHNILKNIVGQIKVDPKPGENSWKNHKSLWDVQQTV